MEDVARNGGVTPRAVADIAAAAVHAAPRAVAVLRYGTHCFLDEASEYEYPDSQCAAASRGEARVSLADRRDAVATVGSSNARASVMSPAAQLEATREYVAAFFVAELRGGGDDFGDDFVSDEKLQAKAARKQAKQSKKQAKQQAKLEKRKSKQLAKQEEGARENSRPPLLRRSAT